MPAGRVLLALDDPALEPSPAWTRIDNTNSLVKQIHIQAGRQSEFDQTETSTATVLCNDREGLFDSNNVGSPFFGLLIGHQIMCQVYDPVRATWEPAFRGHIDDVTHDFNPNTDHNGDLIVANVAIECVGLFEYLANVEMIPGTFGSVGSTTSDGSAPPGSQGSVFYEDTDFQTRLEQLASDAFGGDATKVAAFCRFFTGNINVQESLYEAGENILGAMREVVDAEMPTLGNLFEDRRGRVCAHGRRSVFEPDSVAGTAGTDSWDFHRWRAGDGNAFEADSSRAQIRPPLQWSQPRSRIYNAALSYPKNINQKDIPPLVSLDFPSVDEYGYRSWSAPDLIIKNGITTGNTGAEECALFNEFITANYSQPKRKVEALTFKSVWPDDPRAGAVWEILSQCDVADVIELTHGYPGGSGLSDEPLLVQGREVTIDPLQIGFDMVTLSVNVTRLPIDDVGLLG